MTLVHLDDDDQLVRRQWRPDMFIGPPLPFAPEDDGFTFGPHQPAIVVTNEIFPVFRTVTDVRSGHGASG